MERLECLIRTKQFLVINRSEENKDDNYILFSIHTNMQEPPDASKQTKLVMLQFSSALEKRIVNNKTKPASNLTKLQYNYLKNIIGNCQFIVCMSDKNLGPVIMEHSMYME
jgi:hypothetical protein